MSNLNSPMYTMYRMYSQRIPSIVYHTTLGNPCLYIQHILHTTPKTVRWGRVCRVFRCFVSKVHRSIKFGRWFMYEG